MELGAEVEAKSQRLQDKEKVCGCKTQPPVVQFAVSSLSLHSMPLAGPRLCAATEFPFLQGQERGPGRKTAQRGPCDSLVLRPPGSPCARSHRLLAKVEVASGAAVPISMLAGESWRLWRGQRHSMCLAWGCSRGPLF